jgi:hypothetical protein
VVLLLINIKDIYRETFLAIKRDTKLLDMLEVVYDGVDENTFLTNLRKQVVEANEPENLLNDYSTRICVHERDGGYRTQREEVGYLAVDIHISKDRNKIDGRMSDIVKRVIEVLDTRERNKQGLGKLNVGLYGLQYKNRIFAESRNRGTGWEKYTIYFEYIYIL